MKCLQTLSVLGLGLMLTGCQSAGAASVPARMGASPVSDACITQMQTFITVQEGGMLRTALTSAAFATNSALGIAQAPLIDEKGTLVQGRERSMPSVYLLSKSAMGCTITRESNRQSLLLTRCECTPLRANAF
jgi:hypothetical protein